MVREPEPDASVRDADTEPSPFSATQFFARVHQNARQGNQAKELNAAKTFDHRKQAVASLRAKMLVEA